MRKFTTAAILFGILGIGCGVESEGSIVEFGSVESYELDQGFYETIITTKFGTRVCTSVPNGIDCEWLDGPVRS